MRTFLAGFLLLTGVVLGQVSFSTTLRMIANGRSNANQLWAATERTLYKSEDQGRTYRGVVLRPGVPVQPLIMQIRVDHRNSNVVLVATQDPTAPLFRTADGGLNWTVVPTAIPPGLSGTTFVISTYQPNDIADVFYLRIGTILMKSVDGGVTFAQQAQLPGTGMLAIAGTDPKIMYAAGGNATSGLVVSADEGVTWTAAGSLSAGTVPLAIINAIPTLLVNPRNANQLFGSFFVTYSDPNTPGGRSSSPTFYRSADGGKTWLHQTTGGFTTNITTSLDGSLVMVAGQQNFRTTDFGATTGTVSTAGPYFINSADANRVMTSTHLSTDGGRTFTTFARQYFPQPAVPEPIALTLESGTSYSFTVVPRDSDGGQLSYTSPTLTSTATWVDVGSQNPTGPFNCRVSANGLAAGEYEGRVELVSAALTAPIVMSVKLTVKDKVEPQLRYRSRLFAGNGSSTFGGDGGAATAAGFEEYIAGVAASSGNVYIATKTRVRRVNAFSSIEAFAGGVQGSNGFGDGGPATQARFNLIASISAVGNQIYVVDSGDQRIRLIGADGTISTFYRPVTGSRPSFLSTSTRIRGNAAGEIFVTSGSDGLMKWDGTRFNAVTRNYTYRSTRDSQFDNRGDVVIGESARLLRARVSGEAPTVIAGSETAGFGGDHGQASAAAITGVEGIDVDSNGNIFVVEQRRVRSILPSGVIQTVAGNGDTALALRNGDLANVAGIGQLTSIAIDARGSLYLGLFERQVLVLERVTSVVPRIATGGVVSLAAGARRIAPGAIFSIYGADFAGAAASNTSLLLPRAMGGVQVLVNGTAVPLFYVSAGQINAQMPYGLSGTARVVVTRDGTPSAEQTVDIAAAQPDILTYGANRAVAVNPSGAVNAVGVGASAGDYIVVYLTGIGALDTTVAAGAASPTSPLARAAQSSSATIGDRAAELAFLGLAPGFVGLAQANVRVPDGLAAGDQPLVITVGGVASNRVLMTVR